MAENDVVYSYTGDTTGIMDSLDTISEGIQGLIEDINALVDASSGLGEFEGIFEEIASIFGEVDAAASTTNDYLASLGEQAFTTGEGFNGMASTAAEAMGEIATSSEDASAQIEGLQEMVDQFGGALAEDTAMIDGLNETIQNLQAQLDMLATSADTAAESTSTMGMSLSDVKGAVSGASDNVSGFMGGIGEAVGGIGDFADSVFMGAMKLQIFSQMAEQAGEALFGPAISAEQMQTAFTTLLGSTQAATDEMSKLDAFASKTPFKTMDIDQAASQLIGFGISAQDVVPDLTSIGDALSAVGKGSAANLDQVVNIFGKIQTGGKLTTGIMGQLSRDGINAWSILEQQTGKTQGQLQGMVSAGLIPAKDAMDMLTKGIEANPLYAGGMAKQSATTAGLLSTLQSNWDQMLASFGSPILKATEGDLASVGNTLASPGFKSFASGVGQQIANTFQNIGKFISADVKPAIADISKDLDGPGFKAFASTVGKGLSTAFKDIGDIAKNVVEPAIKGFLDTLKSPQFAEFTGKAGDLATKLNSVLMPAINGLKPIIEGLFNFVQNTALPALSGLADGLSKVINWFQNGGTPAQIVKDALVGIGVAIAAISIGGLVAAIPALVVGFGAWAVSAGAAAVATIAATWPILAIGAGIALVVTGIILAVQHWGQISSWLQGVWAAFSSWFMGALGAVGNFFHGVWNGIVSGLQTAWNAIVNVVKAGAAFLLAAFMGPIVAIAGAFVWLYNHNTYFKALVDAIVKFFQGCFAWLQGAWQNTINWLVGAWNNIVKFATDLWGKVSGAIQTGFSAAIGFVEGIWNDISTTFSNAWTTYIYRPLTTLWTNVSQMFSSAWTTYIAGPIGSLWNNLTTTIGGWAGKAADWGKNLIQGFINGITGMLSNVGDAASKIAGKVAQFLGFHSPAELGPGSAADTWGPNLMNMFIDGIAERQTRLKQVVDGVAHTISDSLNTQLHSQVSAVASISTLGPNPASLPQGPNAVASGLGSPQAMQYLQQIAQGMQGIQRQQLSPSQNANALAAVTQNFGGMNFHGVQDVRALAEAVNALQGQQVLYGQRGAAFYGL